MRVSGYFLLHRPCYLFPKACFHCQENHIWDQESGSFCNCELILCYSRVWEENRQRFKQKENNWFKILPRIGTVVDSKQWVDEKWSDRLANQLADIAELLGVVGFFCIQEKMGKCVFPWARRASAKSWQKTMSSRSKTRAERAAISFKKDSKEKGQRRKRATEVQGKRWSRTLNNSGLLSERTTSP